MRGAYYGADTGWTRKLLATSRLLSRITGMQVQRNKAIVGLNVRTSPASTSTACSSTATPTRSCGRRTWAGGLQLVLGRHSGRAAVADRVRQLGYVLDDAQLDQLIVDAKGADPDQHVVTDRDLQMAGGRRPSARAGGSPACAWPTKAAPCTGGAVPILRVAT